MLVTNSLDKACHSSGKEVATLFFEEVYINEIYKVYTTWSFKQRGFF